MRVIHDFIPFRNIQAGYLKWPYMVIICCVDFCEFVRHFITLFYYSFLLALLLLMHPNWYASLIFNALETIIYFLMFPLQLHWDREFPRRLIFAYTPFWFIISTSFQYLYIESITEIFTLCCMETVIFSTRIYLLCIVYISAGEKSRQDR